MPNEVSPMLAQIRESATKGARAVKEAARKTASKFVPVTKPTDNPRPVGVGPSPKAKAKRAAEVAAAKVAAKVAAAKAAASKKVS